MGVWGLWVLEVIGFRGLRSYGVLGCVRNVAGNGNGGDGEVFGGLFGNGEACVVEACGKPLCHLRFVKSLAVCNVCECNVT